MKTHHRILVVLALVLLVAPSLLVAQSRTEEARKRMKGDSDSESGGLALAVIDLTIDILPELFYFRPLSLNEPRLRYTPHPYSRSGLGRGIRSFTEDGAGRKSMLETRLNLSLPQGALAMDQKAAEVKWHLGYWFINGQYEYLKELEAPYGIHQFNVMGGRKFRFFTSGDAGVSMGYRNVMIGGDRFDGLEMAVHSDLYPVKPFSISYYGGAMGHTYGTITNNRLSVGVHRGPMRFSVGHHWLNIAGIEFNTFSAGFNVYL
jgi:hypothetical protein